MIRRSKEGSPKDYEPQKEQERTVEHAWVFDVDGVLTHPEEKQVMDEALFDQLLERLNTGEPVIMNTGRAYDFVQDRIINNLFARVKDTQHYKHIFVVAEKGALLVMFDQEGNPQELLDESIAVPKVLQDRVRALVADQFSDIAFFDETKRTMISVEMHGGVALADFKQRQQELDRALQKIMQECNLDGNYIIDTTRIASDIQSKEAGKDLGAKKIIAWLASQNITPQHTICFGDGRSDLAMAEELHQQGESVEFVFVGEPQQLQNVQTDFPIIYTDEHCDQGTLAYLTEHQPT